MEAKHDPSSGSILITGATSDIGISIARRLLEMKYHLVLAARDTNKLREAFSSSDQRSLTFVHTDFKNANESINNILNETQKNQLLGIVHCAGLHELKMFALSTAENFQQILEINLLVPLSITRELLTSGRFARAGSSVVWISSTAAIRTEKGLSAYSLAKSGQIAATRSLAKELGGKRIRVNSILAGWVETESARRIHRDYDLMRSEIASESPLGVGLPEDIANATTFLISDSSRWITGSTLVVDGGASL
jgi:NAD(P)-dependent dehydrogenase (short-subunit alcohol dehydrogenase family)